MTSLTDGYELNKDTRLHWA